MRVFPAVKERIPKTEDSLAERVGFELASDQAFTHTNKDPLDGSVFRSDGLELITERDYRRLVADVRH